MVKITKEHIPVKDIHIDDINPRRSVDVESLKDLSESASTYGTIQPIGVHRFNGSIRLIWGKRRLMSAINRQEKKIEANVYEGKMEDLDLFLLSLTENIHREPLSRNEERLAIIRLHKAFKLSIREIANKLKKKKTYISDLVQESKYPVDVLQALDEDLITVKVAKELSVVEDQNIRTQLIQKGKELYPEAVSTLNEGHKTAQDPVEQKFSLLKADKFIKRQLDRLSNLFGNLTSENSKEIIKDILTAAEQAYKPLIGYGFMESKSFCDYTEKEIETILEACVEEDRAAATKYVEFNKQVIKIIEAAEKRASSFRSPTSKISGDPPDPEDHIHITDEKESEEDNLQPYEEGKMSARRTSGALPIIDIDILCREMSDILGIKVIYAGDCDQSPEITLNMSQEEVEALHTKLKDTSFILQSTKELSQLLPAAKK